MTMGQPTSARVVHVTTVAMTLPFLRGLCGHLRAEGLEVHAVASGEPFLQQFSAETGVPCHGIPMARSIGPLRDLKALWALCRLFRQLRPGLVHGHTPKGGMLAMVAARLTGVPVAVYTIHGLPYAASTGVRRALLKTAEMVSCGLADRVFCVSRSMLETACGGGLGASDKFEVLVEGSIAGIDADGRFNPSRVGELGAAWRSAHAIPADATVLTFIGRLTRDKGICELHGAWSALRERNAALRLVLVGPIDTEDRNVLAALEAFSKDAAVRMVGLEWNTPPILAATDVLCLPTYREGFPVTLLEAAAMAVPVVATSVPGCTDAVRDGVTGTLVPAKSAAALAVALQRYIDDPELRARHGAAARARAHADFKPQRIWEQTLTRYAELAEATSKRRLYARYGKRPLDVAVAAFSLLLFSPVLLATAAGIAFTMGRPVLFRQSRPGLHRRVFNLVKFRSMRDGAASPSSDAARLTPFGRFLRASSLDELPELWNVLKGDMSLVGPRPLLTQYLDRYTPEQARRHEVRPGITGWAQVNGRNALGWEEKFAFDVWYVDNCSFWLDVKILALTVWNVAGRRGINQPGHATAQEFMGSVSR